MGCGFPRLFDWHHLWLDNAFHNIRHAYNVPRQVAKMTN